MEYFHFMRRGIAVGSGPPVPRGRTFQHDAEIFLKVLLPRLLRENQRLRAFNNKKSFLFRKIHTASRFYLTYLKGIKFSEFTTSLIILLMTYSMRSFSYGIIIVFAICLYSEPRFFNLKCARCSLSFYATNRVLFDKKILKRIIPKRIASCYVRIR